MSIMLASLLMLNRHFQLQLSVIMLALKGLNNVFCVYTEVTAQDDTVIFE